MKKFIALTAGSIVLFAATNAFAATQTAGMGVGANVPQRCNISAGALNFNITPGSTSDSFTTAQISVNCQGSTPSYSIGIDNGLHQSVDNTQTNPIYLGDRHLANSRGNRIPYDVYRDASHTQRWGDTPSDSSGNRVDRATSADPGAPNFTVYAKVPAAPNAEPGSYNDQLTVTLHY
ncbi:MAG: spore coat U domain-containing protein [Nitrospinota bacterium]